MFHKTLAVFNCIFYIFISIVWGVGVFAGIEENNLFKLLIITLISIVLIVMNIVLNIYFNKYADKVDFDCENKSVKFYKSKNCVTVMTKEVEKITCDYVKYTFMINTGEKVYYQRVSLFGFKPKTLTFINSTNFPNTKLELQ